MEQVEWGPITSTCSINAASYQVSSPRGLSQTNPWMDMRLIILRTDHGGLLRRGAAELRFSPMARLLGPSMGAHACLEPRGSLLVTTGYLAADSQAGV